MRECVCECLGLGREGGVSVAGSVCRGERVSVCACVWSSFPSHQEVANRFSISEHSLPNYLQCITVLVSTLISPTIIYDNLYFKLIFIFSLFLFLCATFNYYEFSFLIYFKSMSSLYS